MVDPSFIPYMTGTKAAFHIELDDRPDDLPAGSEPRYPFVLVDDTCGMTRIIKARVLSDAGSNLGDVFLLMSRDDYQPGRHGLGSLTNLDMESAWQEAFRNHLRGGSILALTAQVDSEGCPRPFRPIFYCSVVRRFFHPPCPQCSDALVLCRDDAALKEAGLKPYSTSLQRYLVCPSCRTADGQRSYYSHAPGASDPVSVKGPNDLISGFGSLTSGEIPCIGCPEHSACYKGNEAPSRVIPLAFYPFHLLVFEAASLNAEDFLALVSGASCQDLEESLAADRKLGRRQLVASFQRSCESPLLFARDERKFLEVLLLKISFLGEVARFVLSGQVRFAHPQMGPLPERLWVKIPRQSSLLPALWTFRLALVDMEPSLPDMSPSPGIDYSAWCLGMLWFHTLVGNRSLDARSINEGLARMLEGELKGSDAQMFGPENIFCAPGEVPAVWGGLWERSLNIGRALLQPQSPTRSMPPDFWDAYGELVNDVREALFSSAGQMHAGSFPVSGDKSADAAIGDILGRIRTKWENLGHVAIHEETPAQAVAPSGEAQPQDELSQTMVAAPVVQQPEKAPLDDDFSTETVIMRHPPAQTVTEEPQALDGTVVITQAQPSAVKKEVEKPAASPVEDDLESTVIMGAPVKASPQAAPGKATAGDDDELEATVIIKPDKKS